MRSNYVCAGGETLLFILNRFMNSDNFQNHFTKEDIDLFFSNTCNKFLHSFGQNFAGRKKYDKYSSQELDLLIKTRNYDFMNSCDWILDSGGFQISIGILDRRESEILFDLYYQFLVDNVKNYDRAFILDIPPGPNCKLFNSFYDVYDLNLKSYQFANSLPADVKNKIVYIHHFRTPHLWNIYSKIMRENNLFNEFQFHATGGIVANSSGDMDIPCIIYVLPLIPLLNECKKYHRTQLKFHVLGGATFRDILFYELFTLHVKKVHNIDLEITYDSSGLFKGVMVARFLPYIDTNSIKKLDIRENSLHLRCKGDLKVIDVYRNLISNMAQEHNFKQISMDKIYNSETGTFYEENRVYTLMYMFQMYKDAQTHLQEKARDLYSLYETNNYDEFNHESELITRFINNDKITKKQKAKTNSILRSLNMLTELDETNCEHIVEKCLSKDEFIDLQTNNTTLYF